MLFRVEDGLIVSSAGCCRVPDLETQLEEVPLYRQKTSLAGS